MMNFKKIIVLGFVLGLGLVQNTYGMGPRPKQEHFDPQVAPATSAAPAQSGPQDVENKVVDLIVATCLNDTDKALRLLNNGVSPTAQDDNGRSALSIALDNNNVKLVRLFLLKHKHDFALSNDRRVVNLSSELWDTLRHIGTPDYASREDQQRKLFELTGVMFELDEVTEIFNDYFGERANRTELMDLCARGLISDVRACLDRSALINFQNYKTGETALMIAASSSCNENRCYPRGTQDAEVSRVCYQIYAEARLGRINTVKELCTRGADVNAQNKNGQTALDIVLEMGEKVRVSRILMLYGARSNHPSFMLLNDELVAVCLGDPGEDLTPDDKLHRLQEELVELTGIRFNEEEVNGFVARMLPANQA